MDGIDLIEDLDAPLAIDEEFGAAVGRALAEDVEIARRASQVEAARFEAVHRDGIPAALARLAATKRDLKAAVAGLEAARREAKARHAAEMEDLAGRIAAVKEKATEDIAADEALIGAHRAFLDRIEGRAGGRG